MKNHKESLRLLEKASKKVARSCMEVSESFKRLEEVTTPKYIHKSIFHK